jgi:2-keto-4-pentenoate hydratase/2-oxohepta-3-ene-1,7-dioic acid hydratase in catechol pathway
MKLANVGAPGKERPIVMTDSDTVFDAGSLTAPGSLKTDWEVELAVVIGTTAPYLASPDQSSAHIAGFTISNDVSERAYQLERGGQWDKGKSCESFNPFGPWGPGSQQQKFQAA